MNRGTRGARPPAEFVHGVPRRSPARGGRAQLCDIEAEWDDNLHTFNATARPPMRQSKKQIKNLQDYSITRPINMGAQNILSWIQFTEDLAARNSNKGSVPDVADLECEFINGASLKRMLADAFPNAYSERNRARNFQIEYARQFNQYMRSLERARTEAVFGALGIVESGYGSLIECGNELIIPVRQDNIGDGPYGLHDETEDRLLRAESDAMLWGQGKFAVSALDKFGRAKFGADLRDNEVLYTEWAAIKDYLRQDRLDLSLITDSDGQETRSFEPNISVFMTAALGGTALTFSALPVYISLHPPSMRLVQSI